LRRSASQLRDTTLEGEHGAVEGGLVAGVTAGGVGLVKEEGVGSDFDAVLVSEEGGGDDPSSVEMGAVAAAEVDEEEFGVGLFLDQGVAARHLDVGEDEVVGVGAADGEIGADAVAFTVGGFEFGDRFDSA
jgi:hypothetical protein